MIVINTDLSTRELTDLNFDMRQWVKHLRRAEARLNPERLARRAKCADIIEECLPLRTSEDLVDLAAAVEHVHDELEACYAP